MFAGKSSLVVQFVDSHFVESYYVSSFLGFSRLWPPLLASAVLFPLCSLATVLNFVCVCVFNDSLQPTIESSFTKTIKLKGQDFLLEIHDTAGQVSLIPHDSRRAPFSSVPICLRRTEMLIKYTSS